MTKKITKRRFNFAFCYEMEGYLKALRDHCPERFDYGKFFKKTQTETCGCLAGMMYCNKKNHVAAPIENIASVWGLGKFKVTNNVEIAVTGINEDARTSDADQVIVRQMARWLGCTIVEAKELYMGFDQVLIYNQRGINGINSALDNLKALRLKYTKKVIR